MRNKISRLCLVMTLAVAGYSLLTSCSSDDSEIKEIKDCNCGKIVQANYFPQSQNVNAFTVFTVENNCTGIQSQYTKSGKYTLGNQYCY